MGNSIFFLSCSFNLMMRWTIPFFSYYIADLEPPISLSSHNSMSRISALNQSGNVNLLGLEISSLRTCTVGWIISRLKSISFSPSSSSSSSYPASHHNPIAIKRDQNFIIDFLSSSTSLENRVPILSMLNPRQTHTSAYRKSIEATHLVFLLFAPYSQP